MEDRKREIEILQTILAAEKELGTLRDFEDSDRAIISPLLDAGIIDGIATSSRNGMYPTRITGIKKNQRTKPHMDALLKEGSNSGVKGVTKKGFKLSKPVIWLVFSSIVILIITFYGTKILNALEGENPALENSQEKHDTTEAPKD